MTKFIVSVAKVEGSGDVEVEQCLGRIYQAVQYVFFHTTKAEFVDNNTLRITYKEEGFES